MRDHIEPAKPVVPPPAPKRVDGIRPAVTQRGREVALNSAATRRALMGTIGRPYV